MPPPDSLPLSPARRGRPREHAEMLVPITTWLPVSIADRLMSTARTQRLPVSELVRLVVVTVTLDQFPTDK